jgi:hypothetical protein
MAVRKMTFSIQDDVASRLMRYVPARDRSRYVSKALAESLRKEDLDLIQACEAANAVADAAEIEREMDAIEDGIEEPWDVRHGSKPRKSTPR